MGKVVLPVVAARTPYQLVVENLERLNDEMVKRAPAVFSYDCSDWEEKERFMTLMAEIGTLQALQEGFIRNGWSK